MLFACHEEDCVEMRAHAAIQQGHLGFDLIVGDGADAAQNHFGLAARGVIDEQARERIDFYVRERGGRLSEHVDAFGDRKERLLLGIFENRYDKLTYQARAARDQVQVAVGWRIEGAWVNGDERRGHDGNFECSGVELDLVQLLQTRWPW